MVERILFGPGGASEAKQDALLASLGDVTTADTVRELLARIYGAVDGLELSADTLNLNVDGVESLLTDIKSKITELDAAFDAEGFAQEASLSDLVSRIGDVTTADTVRELLQRIYTAVDGLELSVDNIDLQTDTLEANQQATTDAVDALKAAENANATAQQGRLDLLATEDTLASVLEALGLSGPFVRGVTDSASEGTTVLPQVLSYATQFNLSGQAETLRLGGNDPSNSSQANLAVDEAFTGQWRGTGPYSSALGFVISTQPLAAVDIEWSPDGVSARAGLLSTSSFLGTEAFLEDALGPGAHLYVYLTVVTTMVDDFIRLTYTNSGTATTVFEADLWLYNNPYGGSFGGLDADLSTLSTALLTRSVQAGTAPDGQFVNAPLDGIAFSDTFEQSGPLPAGATPAFDKVGPIDAPNVIDSGWMYLPRWNYQEFHGFFNVDGVRVFLMNASDDQGNNSTTTNFFFPTGVSEAFAPINTGAKFFNSYFRVIVVNDGGNDCTQWGFQSRAQQGASGPVDLSLDQPIQPFFPAPIVQAIIKGQQPDGDYESVRTSGSDPWNSTALPLGPAGEFTGTAVDTTGYLGGMVLVESDVDSAPQGVIIEFSEDEAFTLVHRALTLTYSAANGAQPRFFPVMQGEYYRLRYINGPIPQARLLVRAELMSAAAQVALGPLNASMSGRNLASMTRSTLVHPNDADEWANATLADDGGLRIAVNEHEVETPIKSKTDWDVRGTTVASSGAVQLSLPAVSGVGTYNFQNEGSGDVFIAKTPDNVLNASRRRRIYPGTSLELDISEAAAAPWAIAADTGGITQDTRLDGDTAAGTASLPTNSLLSDDTYSVVATGQTLEVSGFLAPRVLTEVSQVIIGFEGRIAAGAPTTEDITFVSEYDASAGNVGALTSPSVTSNADHFYMVSVSRKNTASTIQSVSGLGLTWLPVADATDEADRARTAVWRGVGTPTGDSPVQVIFSETATNCTLKVTQWAGVDLDAPIHATETLNPAGAGSSYSDSIDAVQTGAVITVVGCRRRVHTPGSAFTELAKVNTGTGNNDNRLSVSYAAPIVAGGPRAYSGSFDNGADFIVHAIALAPRATQNPSALVSYEVGGEAGDTTVVVEIDDTVDADYLLDVTADRAWTFDDIDNLKVKVSDASASAADVQVDHIFTDVQEAQGGTTQLVTVTAVGDA